MDQLERERFISSQPPRVRGGMVMATVLGVLFVPLFFVTIHKVLAPRRRRVGGTERQDEP